MAYFGRCRGRGAFNLPWLVQPAQEDLHQAVGPPDHNPIVLDSLEPSTGQLGADPVAEDSFSRRVLEVSQSDIVADDHAVENRLYRRSHALGCQICAYRLRPIGMEQVPGGYHIVDARWSVDTGRSWAPSTIMLLRRGHDSHGTGGGRRWKSISSKEDSAHHTDEKHDRDGAKQHVERKQRLGHRPSGA